MLYNLCDVAASIGFSSTHAIIMHVFAVMLFVNIGLQIRVQFKWRDAFDVGSFLAGKKTLGVICIFITKYMPDSLNR